MPSIKKKLAFEELRSVDASTLAGSYVSLGTPMEHPIRIFKISNDSNVGITVSYDGGTTDHEYLPAETFLLIDASANRVWDCEFVLADGVQVSINGSAGIGNIYLSTYYAA